MLINPFKKYEIICKGKDQKLYRWHLNVEPWNKAWRVVNQRIEKGMIFKDYLIISIENVTPIFDGQITNDFKTNLNENNKESKHSIFNEYCQDEPITLDEFDFSVQTSNLGFAVSPSYSQAYRCQICGGVVANDICTDCMFDWDC